MSTAGTFLAFLPVWAFRIVVVGYYLQELENAKHLKDIGKPPDPLKT
jgi:hypothetical protein